MDDGLTTKRPIKIGKDAFGGKSVFFDGNALENDVELSQNNTKHENYINCQKTFAFDPSGRPKLISTSDPNGAIHFWDVSA